MAVISTQPERSAATQEDDARDVEEQEDISIPQQQDSHGREHDDLAGLLPDSFAGFSPAGFPAGSSYNHDQSYGQDSGQHDQQETRDDVDEVQATVPLDLTLPESTNHSRSTSPQANSSNALKRKRRDSQTNQLQQSLVPRSTQQQQQLQPISRSQYTNAPATKALPHIGKVRLEQRTSKRRTRTIDRPALPLWLARALCKPEQDDVDVQRANEVLQSAASLSVCS